MWNFGKAARLILAASAPVLAVAQSSQVRPVAKPSPAGSPVNVQPGGPQPAAARYTSPVQTQPAILQTTQPVVATSVPAPSAPQPVAAQPAPTTPSSAKGSGLASVEYVRGQLTVVSQNATLGAVLKLVAARTGAVMDLAPELQNEPVMAQLGPSSVREVMTALLDSPRIDYIVLGKGDGSDGLQRIVVRTRQSFGRVAMAAVRRPQPKQEAEEETRFDENGHPANGPTAAETKLTQEQLTENWKKAREEQRLAEIKQQEQDREDEKTQPQTEPQPAPQPDPPQQ